MRKIQEESSNCENQTTLSNTDVQICHKLSHISRSSLYHIMELIPHVFRQATARLTAKMAGEFYRAHPLPLCDFHPLSIHCLLPWAFEVKGTV